jgi:preprotein translocase subunit SecE
MILILSLPSLTLHLGVLEETISSDFHVVVFSVAFMLYFALINMLLLLIMNFINEVK